MKHFLLSLFVAVFFAASLSPAVAQVPRMFSYQGVVLDPTTGKFIADGQHSIQLKLYSTLAGGSAIYTENQTNIVFVNGVFNVMIGSVTSIPGSVAFDRGYFLGISIDAGTELAPRTALSPAPYAIHAMVADALAPGATGVVTSVNGQSGALTLHAGIGALVNTTGDTITISSTGVGGTGIQGVQNADPSMVVANPTGPIASVAVALAGITTTKIADLAVTPAKIDGSGATSGMVLTANGLGAAGWVTPPASSGSFVLPYSNSIGNANALFSVTNTGTGESGLFSVSNAASTALALTGTSNGAANSIGLYGGNTGNGRAGFIEITNANNASTALIGKTQGTGNAADILISNTSNSADVLHSTTNGTGRAGYFAVSNTSPSQPALEVNTLSTASTTVGILSTIASSTTGASNVAAAVKGDHEGTTSVGMGVWGKHAGTGTGVFGSVNGNGGYGVAATAFGASSTAMLATYSGGGNSGVALELNNGFIKVSGGSRSAYVHTTSAANNDPNNTNSTILGYPGMSSLDIVIVTHYWQVNRLNNGYGVWWNQNNNAWEIFLENNPAAAMPNGEKFNVLVIKQ